jgi:hypothetical protein
MRRGFLLSHEFLHADDVMPFEGDETDYISPSVFDIPREVDLDTSAAGDVQLRFVYPDREEADPKEVLLDERVGVPIYIKRGRYSGKLMALRLSDGAAHLRTVAERLRNVAPLQKRKNQELNFLLVSNILRKKQDELQPA